VQLDSLAALAAHEAEIVVADSGAARALSAALAHSAAERVAWRPPRVLTWTNCLTRAIDDAALGGATLPFDFVLNPEQELALWQAVISADDASSGNAPEALARLARDAWSLVHGYDWAWPPSSSGMSVEASAFVRWSTAYARRTAQLQASDPMRVLAYARKPPNARVHGIVSAAPRLARWLELADDSPAVPAQGFTPHAFADREQELYAALDWARQVNTQAPRARVVVASDSLHEDAALVMRALQDVFSDPTAVYADIHPALAADPRIALAWLEIEPVMQWDAVSALLLSAHFGAAGEERAARALADAALRRRRRFELPLTWVIDELATGAPRMAAALRAVLALKAVLPARQSLARWLEHFARMLVAGAWQNDVQGAVNAWRLHQDWDAACERLRRLDAVLPAQTEREALARLRRILHETKATPPSALPAIFIVTPLIATLIDADYLWLCGCESAALVTGPRANPCLPLAQQRASAMPGTDPSRDLARARRVLAALTRARGACIASYRRGDGELSYSPSPLIPELRAAQVRAMRTIAIDATRRAEWEVLDDERGVALCTSANVRGGEATFAAQAACPFRAYARHRLRAREVEEPQPGLAAVERGSTLHRALAVLWSSLREHAALCALTPTARADLIESAVLAAVPRRASATALEQAVDVVERERLSHLIEDWLAVEAERSPFSVLAIEAPARVALGGIVIDVRLDRLDRLADGRELIIDYKTGVADTGDWQPPRLDAPQLPLYAITAGRAALAVIAFAHVVRDKPALMADAPLDVVDPAAWQARCAAWRADLEHLAGEIKQGIATVAPKHGPATCRECEQALFCRIGNIDPDADDGTLDDG